MVLLLRTPYYVRTVAAAPYGCTAPDFRRCAAVYNVRCVAKKNNLYPRGKSLQLKYNQRYSETTRDQIKFKTLVYYYI